MAASFSTSLFLVFSSLLIFSSLLYVSEADYSAPITKGLSWDYHHKTCHKVEKIVRKHLKKVFNKDISQAAGLLRLHFHDCFVQGCDGSVLLDGSHGGPSEQTHHPTKVYEKRRSTSSKIYGIWSIENAGESCLVLILLLLRLVMLFIWYIVTI
ncbi:putative peroxidase [Helianthus annuus]|nr:putative peroxidase [Helianthus annuus]